MTTHHRTAHDDTSPGASLHEQAERISRKVSESAQQVWLAGLGALGRAQAEGSRLFDTLVKEGEAFEQQARQDPDRGAPLRDSVENTLGQARERATGTWEKMEKAFEDRLQGALRRMQIPSREDIDALNQRIDALNSRLNRAESRASQPAGGDASKADAGD